MTRNRLLLLLTLQALTACGLSLDPSLDGKRCDDKGACVSGYVCSPLGICERAPLVLDAAVVDANVASSTADASFDAGVPASTPDAAASDAQVAATGPSNAATTAPPSASNRVTSAIDSGIPDADQTDAGAGADASQSDAASTQDAPDAQVSNKPDASQHDADVPVMPPPTTTSPPAMMMPGAPPSPGREPRPPVPGTSPPGVPPPPDVKMDCPVEASKCQDACVYLQADSDHCGACDNACAKHEWCKAGTCRKAGP